jgi:hypothetical protein
MKRCRFLILFTLTFVSAFGQSQSNDYHLALNFAPSFMSASQMIIRANRDSGSLNIRIYKNFKNKEYRVDSTVVIPATKLTALTNFLKTYKFRIKNNIDTVGAHKVFEQGDSVLVYEVSMGTDGIDVYGVFNKNDFTHNFAFWSPEKGTENARFMELILALTESVFTGKQTIDYLEQLEQYFPHHLGLKKVSDHSPLTFKLYGGISSDDQDELDVFLKNLPLHTKVIIDMSNFSGMGTMFYSWFEDYCAGKKNIYWLNPTDGGLIDLYKIGIANRYVISKKKIRKIKTIKGREVILYNTD